MQKKERDRHRSIATLQPSTTRLAVICLTLVFSHSFKRLGRPCAEMSSPKDVVYQVREEEQPEISSRPASPTTPLGLRLRFDSRSPSPEPKRSTEEPLPFTTLRGESHFDIKFESIEAFVGWLQKSSFPVRQSIGLDAWDSSAVGRMRVSIREPSVYLMTIKQVQWVYWGDGGVRLICFTDDIPTPNPALDRLLQQHAQKEADRRGEFRRQKQCLQGICKGFPGAVGIPFAIWLFVLQYLLPKSLCKPTGSTHEPKVQS